MRVSLLFKLGKLMYIHLFREQRVLEPPPRIFAAARVVQTQDGGSTKKESIRACFYGNQFTREPKNYMLRLSLKQLMALAK